MSVSASLSKHRLPTVLTGTGARGAEAGRIRVHLWSDFPTGEKIESALYKRFVLVKTCLEYSCLWSRL